MFLSILQKLFLFSLMKPVGFIRLVAINLLVACAMTAAGILAMETAIGFRRRFLLPPDQLPHVTWGHKASLNAYRFRERELSVFSSGESFRVMVLGDSLTWGVGLDEDERFTDLLEERLRRESPGKNIRVMNFGLPGSSTQRERDLLRDFYPLVRPQLIIVAFCFNDPQPREQQYSSELEHHLEKIRPLLQAFQAYGFDGTRRVLTRAYVNLLTRTRKIPTPDEALQRAYEPRSEEWRAFLQALRDIAAMNRAVTTNPPVFFSLNQNPESMEAMHLPWHHQAERAAADAGFVVANCETELWSAFAGKDVSVLPGVDFHPNAAVNALYARKLSEVLARRGLTRVRGSRMELPSL